MSRSYPHMMTVIANHIPTMTSADAARQIEMFRQQMDGLRGIAKTYAEGSEERANVFASMDEIIKLNNLCCRRYAAAQAEEFAAFIAQ